MVAIYLRTMLLLPLTLFMISIMLPACHGGGTNCGGCHSTESTIQLDGFGVDMVLLIDPNMTRDVDDASQGINRLMKAIVCHFQDDQFALNSSGHEGIRISVQLMQQRTTESGKPIDWLEEFVPFSARSRDQVCIGIDNAILKASSELTGGNVLAPNGLCGAIRQLNKTVSKRVS